MRALKTGINSGCWWKELFHRFVILDFSFLPLPLGQQWRHELDARFCHGLPLNLLAVKPLSDFNWHSGCWKLWKWSWYRYPVSQCALEEPFGFACVSPFHPDAPLNFCTNPTINRMLHLLPFKSLSKSIYISLSPRCICAVSEKKNYEHSNLRCKTALWQKSVGA